MKYNRIHILGAPGSGTTTLASELSKKLPYRHFDSDDYLWKVKYSEIQPGDIRLSLLRKDLINREKWILSGAVIDWGNPLISLFDLIIFLSVPNEIRIERLRQRETARYGDRILPGNDRYSEFRRFLEWASLYETEDPNTRNRRQQEQWMEGLNIPVLRISGDLPLNDNVEYALNFITGK